MTSADRDHALTLERYGRSVTRYVLSFEVEVGDVLVRWGLTVRQRRALRRRGLPVIEIYGEAPRAGGLTLWFEASRLVEVERVILTP